MAGVRFHKTSHPYSWKKPFYLYFEQLAIYAIYLATTLIYICIRVLYGIGYNNDHEIKELLSDFTGAKKGRAVDQSVIFCLFVRVYVVFLHPSRLALNPLQQ